QRIPSAAGLSNFVRLLFGAFGTSITTTLWENRASLHHAQLTEAARPGTPAFDAAMSGLQQHGLGHDQSATVINQLISEQAFTMSASGIVSASASLCLRLIALIRVARPGSSRASGAASGAH